MISPGGCGQFRKSCARRAFDLDRDVPLFVTAWQEMSEDIAQVKLKEKR
jgi:hypothetical protein